MGDVISTFLFQPPEEPTPIARSKVFWLETRLGSRIPAFYINRFPGRFTILYSHGNAEDLGMLYEYLKELSRLLKVNIMAYDYTGYGLANVANEVERWAFTPSEEHCYADIEAAYHHLTDVEDIEPASIILYGRSVGSGPSCYLAEKMFIGIESEKRCGGMILHSPFLSVCRVVVDMGFTVNGDLFPNIERVQHLGCPVFVIHGTEDAVVPFHHGQKLYEALPPKYRAPPFWAKNLGHNDVELHQPRQFIKELRNFLALASRSPRLQRSARFAGTGPISSSSRSSDEFDVAPMTFGKSTRVESPPRARRSARPVRFEDSGASPLRGGSHGPPGILKNGSGQGQSVYAKDMRQGRDERLLPSPPPTKKLLNVKVEKGSGRVGPILGNEDVRRPRVASPRDSRVPQSTSRPSSPVQQRRTKEERSKSTFERQQQVIKARVTSTRRR